MADGALFLLDETFNTSDSALDSANLVASGLSKLILERSVGLVELSQNNLVVLELVLHFAYNTTFSGRKLYSRRSKRDTGVGLSNSSDSSVDLFDPLLESSDRLLQVMDLSLSISLGSSIENSRNLLLKSRNFGSSSFNAAVVLLDLLVESVHDVLFGGAEYLRSNRSRVFKLGVSLLDLVDLGMGRLSFAAQSIDSLLNNSALLGCDTISVKLDLLVRNLSVKTLQVLGELSNFRLHNVHCLLLGSTQVVRSKGTDIAVGDGVDALLSVTDFLLVSLDLLVQRRNVLLDDSLLRRSSNIKFLVELVDLSLDHSHLVVVLFKGGLESVNLLDLTISQVSQMEAILMVVLDIVDLVEETLDFSSNT